MNPVWWSFDELHGVTVSEDLVYRACQSDTFTPTGFDYSEKRCSRGLSSVAFSSGVCQFAVRMLHSADMNVCFYDLDGNPYIEVLLPRYRIVIDGDVWTTHHYLEAGNTIFVRLDLRARKLSLTVDAEPELS